MIVNEGGKNYNVSVKENGDKFWYFNGKLHRELGPAIELANGGKVWWLDGFKCLNEQSFKEKLKLTKLASEKKYYDVKITAMIPATLTYKVLANSPEQAAQMIKNLQPNHVHHKIVGKKDIKLVVFDSGTTLIRFVKNFLGL